MGKRFLRNEAGSVLVIGRSGGESHDIRCTGSGVPPSERVVCLCRPAGLIAFPRRGTPPPCDSIIRVEGNVISQITQSLSGIKAQRACLLVNKC
jgi:hypothetical protein